MTDRELRGYVQRLYRYKSISDKQFRNAVNNLELLRDADPHFYYFNMGKLHSLFGDANEALYYLDKALEIKPDNPTCYYNMFKCYVKNGDFAKAYEVLNGFIFYNQKEVDLSLHINLLNTIMCLDTDFLGYLKNDNEVKESTKCGFNDLGDNPELAKLYGEVIAAYNKRNYVEALSKLQRMDYIINECKYPMEVETLITLVKAVKEKEANHYLSGMNDDELRNGDYITYCNYCLRLYELGKYNQESFLRKIEEIINDGSLESADYLLNLVSGNKDFEKYLDMVEYLSGFVREKKAFASLDEEQQNDFTTKRLAAKGKYKRKQNEACLEAYTALKDEYSLPICDYYIAKVMFRMGMFSQAKEKFLSYLEQGGVKTEKAYMFLAKIERIRKNNAEACKWTNKMHKVHKVFARDFDYISEKNYRKRKKAGLLEDKDDQNDVVKRNKSRFIRMDEADFDSSRELLVEDFYDTDIDGKLIIIRGLYRSGSVAVANKLFEEVQKECAPEERGKVKQFDRNRKIYKNQNRTGF